MAKYDLNIREGEVKNLVKVDWFAKYDTTKEIGNIDLSVCVPTEPGQLEIFDLDFFLWAEAKKGDKEDIDDSFVQLIITIMKARTYNDYLPPKYLGAFDAEKIAFIPYDDELQRKVIYDQVLENKIDWTRITPSDHSTEEFALVKKKARDILSNNKVQYDFIKDEKVLRKFIKDNFVAKTGTNKINITLNRMTSIFNRWLEEVKPTINVPWSDLAKEHILPADFFLADAFSKDNHSLGKSLQVLLHSNEYHIKLKHKIGSLYKDFVSEGFEFFDNQKAHKTFWNKYNRPPRRKEREMMQTRRDLLIEPDRRERKGAYFTPSKWVDLSQEYLAKVLNKDGQNWQEEYYVWDCCAGTGNLLFGLTEKERIFASTLDEADVTYMKTQENLLPAHVFQFDFLNDDLQSDKVPEDLKRILRDPEERKKLVIYINPPYAETGTGQGKGFKLGVSESKICRDYTSKLGKARMELFAQFFMRINQEIPGATLAEFSTLKILQASNFADFRKNFHAKLLSAFIVPANTFDNVKGQFPIGFLIWDSNEKAIYNNDYFRVDVYDAKGYFMHEKEVLIPDCNLKRINDWLRCYFDKGRQSVGVVHNNKNDFQHNNQVCITLADNKDHTASISRKNILPMSVYLAVRHCIDATWLNDRDQFLYPRNAWKEDKEFQYDCLAYTLFHGQNRITSKEGKNHWIPFTEKEVKAPMLFESHFMSDFIAGKIQSQAAETLFGEEESLIPTEPIQFSPEAQAVMDAGRELWKYYMWQRNINVNASYYDIRRYFQKEKNGKMNPDSDDPTYMRLWGNIKDALKVLAKKIEPKVYLYGFLLDETTLPEDEPSKLPVPKKKQVKSTKPKQKKVSTTKSPMVVNNYGTLNLYEK